ncbi:MAG: thermonuclease family protein, partial [Acidimicrobiales bacterium]
MDRTIAFGLAVLLGLSGACALPGRTSSQPRPAGVGVVTHPVDGDTVDVDLGGVDERVRLIGVDTPETHFGTQPYGAEASEFAKRHLEGKDMILEL